MTSHMISNMISNQTWYHEVQDRPKWGHSRSNRSGMLWRFHFHIFEGLWEFHICQDGDTCGVVQASSKNVVEPCRNTKFRRCGWVLLLRGSFVCPAGVRIWLQVVIPERREDEFVLPGRRGLTRNPGASTWCMCLESVPPPLKRELP